MRRMLRVPDERESLAEEAREMRRLGPSERVALFCAIMRTIQTVWTPLPFAERLRRVRIGEDLEPGPQPWWLGMRPGARP